MLLFSSTYNDDVMKFAKIVVPDPIIIRLRPEEEIPDNIKQYYVVCRDKEDKFQALSNMYGVVSIGQCIVFCQVITVWLCSVSCFLTLPSVPTAGRVRKQLTLQTSTTEGRVSL